MLGASGVGKSTLINALLGTELATTEIRGDGKGRHTTAWRELLEVPGGGYLIDTPGLRAVGLSDAQDGVDAVFVDIGDYASLCRFRDCQHDGEPDCEVGRAIDSGELDPARLERFRKLQREVDYQARRLDARARAEHTKQWLAMVKGNRKARP
jgi:ribosome biogenesis GTPase